MSWRPSRRAVLRVVGALGAASLAGCQWDESRTEENNLFLENTKQGDQVVQLIVVEGEQITRDRMIDAWYRVPERTALEMGNVLEPGVTYTIGLNAEEEPEPEQIGVTVDPCEGDATRDVSVRVREESHGVIPWGCDEEYTERELDYVDAEEHRIERPDDVETWATPARQETEADGDDDGDDDGDGAGTDGENGES